MRALPFALICLVFASACAPKAALVAGPTSPETRCPPRFEPIAGNSCLALPPDPNAGTPLVLFFHGMYPVDGPDQEFASEARFAEAAQREGFAVLAPRGEVGQCDWSPELADVLCWPLQVKQRPQVGELLVRLAPAFEETRRRLHATGLRPFLAGFSVGGYMATLVASETKLPIRAMSVLHGGPPDGASFPAERAVPTLVLSADQDEQFGPDSAQLHQLMLAHGWANTHRHHPGIHEIAQADASATIEFFREHL